MITELYTAVLPKPLLSTNRDRIATEPQLVMFARPVLKFPFQQPNYKDFTWISNDTKDAATFWIFSSLLFFL